MIKREEDLYAIWMDFCHQGSLTKDNRLRGIYAGQLNRFCGPDFQGAEFELDGTIYRGDVEIHLRTNDWYNHHHHLDNNYDHVLLHLVLDEIGQSSVNNSKMREVCTLGFKIFPAFPQPKIRKGQCFEQEKNIKEVRHHLIELSIDRFQSRQIRFRKNAEKMTYDQMIFQQIMRIIGKPNNEKTFQYLSAILTWNDLMVIKERFKMSYEDWIALFAIKSDLISVMPEFFPLKSLIGRIEAINNRQGLKSSMWFSAGQRPFNKPGHHLKILAFWLHRFEGQSLYHEFKSKLRERLPNVIMLGELEKVFKIKSSENISQQRKINVATKEIKWGRSQVIEILGNVILPFFDWEAGHQSNFGFQRYLQSIYLSLPQLTPYAVLKPFYKNPYWSDIKFNKFYMNQGLFNLKDKYCELNDCQTCPIVVNNKDIDINPENI